MASAPSHPALDSLHMEKTPRRSTPPSGSVVVDPTSQLPSASGPPSSGRRTSQGGGASAPARRKGEATLVLDARKVDTLRRQVVERQRAQQQGRRRQVVLWALAGAGAVLLGGWLATRLSPQSADRGEAALLLGRTEQDAEVLSPPPSPTELRGPSFASAKQDEPSGPRGATSVRSASGVGSAREGDAAPGDSEAVPSAGQEIAEAGERARAEEERSPDRPKVVGDWGDGFDSSGRASSGSPPSRQTRPAATGSDVFELDELPTE